MNKHFRVWSFQEAKAKLSEVIRLAQSQGPQTVTVHGKIAVIIKAVKDDAAVGETGASLVALLGNSPLKAFSAESARRVKSYSKNRIVDL